MKTNGMNTSRLRWLDVLTVRMKADGITKGCSEWNSMPTQVYLCREGTSPVFMRNSGWENIYVEEARACRVNYLTEQFHVRFLLP